jgi:ketol-acid reductoisomerase
MRRMLAEIVDGTYARAWIAEDRAGRPWFTATQQAEQQHGIEAVGARLRAMMPFLDAVTVESEQPAATAGLTSGSRAAVSTAPASST